MTETNRTLCKLRLADTGEETSNLEVLETLEKLNDVLEAAGINFEELEAEDNPVIGSENSLEPQP